MFLPGGLNWKQWGDTAMLFRLAKEGNVGERMQEDMRALYDGSVRYCDDKGLGPLLSKLRQLDLYDNTLIVITADHGQEFLEHGAFVHMQTYNETARVPLVFRGPSIPRGLRIARVVELADVMPTILSLLSIAIPGYVQGVNLAPLFSGEKLQKHAAYVDGFVRHSKIKSHIVMERGGRRWSYLNWVRKSLQGGRPTFEVTGPGELYLLDTDSGQKLNLVRKHPVVAEKLKTELLRWYAENESFAREMNLSKQGESALSEEDKQELKEILRDLHYER
jgi:arylsulfatase A-like enzyme